MVREIKLNKGMVALVDDEDFEYLSGWKWYRSAEGYAIRSQYLGGGEKNRMTKTILMHRVILNTPEGMLTDHINHNTLDNRRSNLRICTRKQNRRNIPKDLRKTTSSYKGVCWNKKAEKWQAQIGIGGKRLTLGRFTSELEAAATYNAAAIKYHGEFACLNELPTLDRLLGKEGN